MKKHISGLDYKIKEMADRIRELRHIMGLSVDDMAQKTDTSIEEYLACESGESDLNFAFLYRCALAFNVDVTDIIEGSSPKLNTYTITRKGQGQRIEQAHGMIYYNMAHTFKNRIAEPLFVEGVYSDEAQSQDIELTTHEGHEFDIVIKGQLKVQIGSHKEILNEGDTIYYDSSIPHGMMAVGGEECQFYAIVLDPNNYEAHQHQPLQSLTPLRPSKDDNLIYKKFITPTEDENGLLQKLDFHNVENFNFAYDIIDVLGTTKPHKLAMLHIAEDFSEQRFTFEDFMKASSQCANYFTSLGIKKGDRVVLCLKRHYQFWFAILALHKIGAVAILATNMLQEHDFSYRFNAAEVSAVICTADGDTAHQVELALKDSPTVKTKIIVNGKREGWLDFEMHQNFSSSFPRPENAPGGDDLLLMYFTSGTTGYPKIAAHNHRYPLGHFHTAKYWHCVNPDGLHLTVSDTGWAKSMWGKLYGQWLCEAGIFVYDYDRFDASVLLPMFSKYHITTFCAPPTIYRMMIKQDLTQYDFSSVEHATIAGEALNPEVFKQWESLTGLQVMEGFGQSETTCVIGNLRGTPHKLGSMGKVIPHYDVALLDSEGKAVPVGETGEICINVANGAPYGLFTGYYGNEEKTAEVWHDGYYHTGDLAWKDEDGYFYYIGRADDVIKSSGYRIGPFEIESVIMELPYVLECGVSPEPDPVRGQIVKASIVLVPGKEPTEELKKEIQTYVKEHTAPYKYPRKVVFCNELPKTTSGKIIRNKL